MKKTLQELTIIDDFLFGAVMSDPENCRLLLERILGISIDHVEVITEKELRYRPEFKGVRLDVYAKDDDNTHFNVEMQVKRTPIEKRSRYYHAQMDMDLLLSGTSYEQLPDGYVIFLCNYDHFKKGKYRYDIRSKCEQLPDLAFNDGLHTIILNNKGKNPDEVPEELVRFLRFTNEKLEESEKVSEDAFVRRIQQTIYQIKSSREMEVRYMSFLDIINDKVNELATEKAKELAAEKVNEAKIEGKMEDRISSILDILSIHGSVPTSLKEKLLTIDDFDLLKKLTLIAAQISNISEFETKLQELTK